MIEILRNQDAENLLFEAKDGGKTLALCEAAAEEKTLVIIRAEGTGAMLDGTVRALLAYGESHFFRDFVLSDSFSGDIDEMKRLGFVENDKKLTNNISLFFQTHKNCKK